MLNRLLESNARKERNQAITAASVAVHGVLIVVAAYATAAGAPPVPDIEEPPRIHFARSPHRPATIRTPRLTQVARTTTALPSIAVPIEVPSILPDISAPLGPIAREDFAQPTGTAAATGDSSAASGPAGGGSVYDATEVEFPVKVLRAGRPEYPAGMRAAGIEGQVAAQFVVDETGSPLAESIRILSSTNALFGASVKRTIPEMKFSPARIGSHAVPQLVQQMFVFRLDR